MTVRCSAGFNVAMKGLNNYAYIKCNHGSVTHATWLRYVAYSQRLKFAALLVVMFRITNGRCRLYALDQYLKRRTLEWREISIRPNASSWSGYAETTHVTTEINSHMRYVVTYILLRDNSTGIMTRLQVNNYCQRKTGQSTRPNASRIMPPPGLQI